MMSRFLTTSNFQHPEVLDELQGVTKKGDGWMALCPVHDDTNPSLSIHVDTEGKVLMFCHACLANGTDVENALTRAIASPVETVPREVKPMVQRLHPETARYCYVDESGQALYDIVRYGEGQGKTFRMHLPNRHSGGVGDVCRVLYRLQDVIAAVRAERMIYLVEGEKDVDRLVSYGLTATTNPNGAGKWDDGYSDVLRGARVAILPDNDEPGRRHALQVETSLARHGADVTIVELPELPEKGDVSNWLDMDNSIEELVVYAEHGSERRIQPQTTTDTSHLVPVNFQTLKAELAEDGQWLVDPILPTRRSTSIVSKGGTGKSLLALEIAASLATGQQVLLQPPGEPVHVVYIDMEMSYDDLDERLTELGYDYEFDSTLQAHLHYYLHADFSPFDKAKGGDEIVSVALQHEASLVVIDTLARVVEGPENDADTYRHFDLHAGRRLKAEGIATLRLDHLGKTSGKGARGSSAKRDDVDVEWILSKGSSGAVELELTKGRMPWIRPNVVLTRETDPLRHTLRPSNLTDAQLAVVKALESIKAPHDITRNAARKSLKPLGVKLSNSDWKGVRQGLATVTRIHDDRSVTPGPIQSPDGLPHEDPDVFPE